MTNSQRPGSGQSDTYEHYASGASDRLGTTDRETLIEDMVDHNFDREEAEEAVDIFLEELNDE